MNEEIFDVIIAGAGPAGLTCALHLADTGLSIAVIDKKTGFGDKICGDALSGTVMNSLKKLPGNAFEEFSRIEEKNPSYGIRFFAPSGEFLDVPFRENEDHSTPAPGYICSRKIFDQFLHLQIQKHSNIRYFPGTLITGYRHTGDGVIAESANTLFKGKILVAADGSNSAAAKALAGKINNKEDICLGARTYYKDVSGLHPENYIELHFLPELLPGYLWIFPMHSGIANVGLGIMAETAKAEKYPLTKKLDDILQNNPVFKERFRNAEKIEKTGAHTLAMGPSGSALSGERFLLLGDAASLVDPFTGEGIGNAMVSGEIAAGIIRNAFNKDSYSADYLKEYDELIKQKLYPDLILDKKLQKLVKSEWLFNYVVRRVNKSSSLRKEFIRMYTDVDARKLLKSPFFYLKMIFG